MSTEPNTGLTRQEPGSLTTDALHNQVVELLGVWLNCAVQSIGDTVPPGSPVNGERYIVGASATGAWATHDDELAIYRDGWQFYAPPAAGVPIIKNLDDGTDWECVAGVWAEKAGGGGGGAWFVRFTPRDHEPPTSDYATLDTRNSRPVLDFDTTTQEAAVFSAVLPNDYASAGVTIDIFCAMTSATSGTVGWDVAFERTQASTDDIDSDSFATAQTVTAATVPGTSGHVLKMSINVSDGADMDSVAAGELFRLRVRRDVANDTAAGDAELLAVTMRGQ